MKDLTGRRVFFKRKALLTLTGYWCKRWDNLELRGLLSRPYEPRFHVDQQFLEGYYVSLKRISFLWYRGLFSVGRHLQSGRYYRDPIHLSVKNLGPRELVFPRSLVGSLATLALLGDWTRYQLAASGWDQAIKKPSRSGKGPGIKLNVSAVRIAVPPPLLTRWGTQKESSSTVCLEGHVVDGPLADLELLVPIREVYWQDL